VIMPGVLNKHPLFLADHYAHAAAPVYLRGLWWIVLASSALLPVSFPSAIRPLVVWVVAYPLPAAASLASAVAIICWQYRPSLQLRFSTSWLAALPISTTQRTLWEAARTARLFVPIVLFLITAFLITSPSAHGDLLSLLFLSVLVGYVLGFGLAGRSTHQDSGAPTDALRLPIAGPGRYAIAKVPLAWTAARLSGKRMAPWLTATLLTIPGGIGGGPSMLLVAVTVLTLALVWLVAGAWRHLFLLADWLVATPLSPRTFARLTLLRVSVWFFAVLFLQLAVLALLQMPVEGVTFIASCVIGGALACFGTAFRYRFDAVRARRSALSIVMGFGIILLFAPARSLVLIALMITLWQLRHSKP
jgi:hypothetical protein